MAREKVRGKLLEFIAKFKPLSIFPGEWESGVGGQGFDFFQIKPYEQGDDLRNIHFSSLIQTGEKRIIERAAQMQVSIYIYSDFSASMARDEEFEFFSKADTRDATTALICFSAAKIYSPLGLVAFSDKARQIFPPVMGEEYADRLAYWGIKQGAFPGVASIGTVLSHVQTFSKPRSLIFLISDFLDIEDSALIEELPLVSRRFDVIPVIVRSEQEKKMLSAREGARFPFIEAETGRVREERLTNARKQKMREAWERHDKKLRDLFSGANLQWAEVSFPGECFPRLQGIFSARQSK